MMTLERPLGHDFPGPATWVVRVDAGSERSLDVLVWPSLLTQLLLQSYLTCMDTNTVLMLNNTAHICCVQRKKGNCGRKVKRTHCFGLVMN